MNHQQNIDHFKKKWNYLDYHVEKWLKMAAPMLTLNAKRKYGSSQLLWRHLLINMNTNTKPPIYRGSGLIRLTHSSGNLFQSFNTLWENMYFLMSNLCPLLSLSIQKKHIFTQPLISMHYFKNLDLVATNSSRF